MNIVERFNALAPWIQWGILGAVVAALFVVVAAIVLRAGAPPTPLWYISEQGEKQDGQFVMKVAIADPRHYPEIDDWAPVIERALDECDKAQADLCVLQFAPGVFKIASPIRTTRIHPLKGD